MKRFAILLMALGSALMLIQAGCGGGGGGGGVGAGNPAFTTVNNLAAPNLTTPAFSGAVAVDEGAGTAADPVIAVGAADNGAGALRAVAWQVTGTGATVANTAVPLLPAGVYSRANGINFAGTIIGEMNTPIVPAIWRSTGLAAVAIPIGAGATSGAAYGINDAGRIVGETINAQGVPTAVFWVADNATVSAPTPLTVGSSTAHAISNTTTIVEIVGEKTDADGTHAVVWRDNTASIADPIIETVLPGLLTSTPALNGESTALSINANGVIVGEITDADGFLHAVRWTKGANGIYTAQDMGRGTATAINSGGRVVGIAPTGTAGADSASAWGAGGVAPILMNAGLSGGHAYGISDSGRAAGVNAAGKAFIALP